MTRYLKMLLPVVLLASPAAAQQEPATEQSGPVTRQTAIRDTPLLDFEYSWPQAIATEARLVAQLNADLSKSYEEALQNARENKALMDENNASFNQNQFTRIWTLEGQTARLISLISNTDTYTGGAHPNHNSSALLWDRSANRQIELGQLFESPTGFESAVRTGYCKLLDAERLKRREGETLDAFNECPAFSELTIAPADTAGGGSFDAIRLIADPYVAGPYSEGSYDITVAASPSVISALKPEYRSDFRAQRAQ